EGPPGKGHSTKGNAEQVGTPNGGRVLLNVPAAVSDDKFLAGGQRSEEATANLNAMNKLYPRAPWVLSFSYARALQDPAMRAWGGRTENVPAAQKAFHQRVKMNSLARAGQWTPELERAA